MKTWLVSSLGCGNYSRVETIQGRKLFREIRYFKELLEVVWRCYNDHFCLDNDQKLWDPFFLSQRKWFQLHQTVLHTLSSLVNGYAHLFFLREKKKTSLLVIFYVKNKIVLPSLPYPFINPFLVVREERVCWFLSLQTSTLKLTLIFK